MKYCKKCLTTDLRPNADFYEGVCIACRYSSSNQESNKILKLKSLQEKVKQSQRNMKVKGGYDCIVGVSGGKDSTRQAHWVRDRLGLRPLLICCAYPPKQMSAIGAENLSNLIEMGFDLLIATPAPETSSRLSLKSFKQFGNVCKASEMALFSTVPRLAIELGIKMIFWGENPALQVGDAAVDGQDEFDGNSLRHLNTLKAGGKGWLKGELNYPYLGTHYSYPDELEFQKKKINIFYLGPAWDDWGNEDNSIYASLQGLSLRPGEEWETGDLSNASMLDEEFTNINMMLKYYKFGFGRATDIVNEKIRSGTLTRREAVTIVEAYDGLCSDHIIENYSKYVGISVREFWQTANIWVNDSIFDVYDDGRPARKFTVGIDYDS